MKAIMGSQQPSSWTTFPVSEITKLATKQGKLHFVLTESFLLKALQGSKVRHVTEKQS